MTLNVVASLAGTVANTAKVTAASTYQPTVLVGGFALNGTLEVASGVTVDASAFNAGGGLTLGASASLGGAGRVTGANINLVGGNNLYSAGTLTLPGLTVSGTGNQIASGTVSATSGATINPGAVLQLGDGTANNGNFSGSINNSGSLVFANPNSQTFSGAISGNGSLTKQATGTLTLTSLGNDYSGPTLINSGTLFASRGYVLSPNSDVTVNAGATLDVTAGSQTVQSLTMSSSLSTLNLGIGNLLTCTNPSTLAGTLNLSNPAYLSSVPGQNVELISFFGTSYSGSFSATPLTGYTLVYNANGTELDLDPILTGPATWNTGNGSWSGGGNWNSGQAPSGVGVPAVLGMTATASATVTLDVPVTLGSLSLGNTAQANASGGTAGYTIMANSPTNSLTMALASGTAATITVTTTGSHVINAPIVLASNLDVTTTSAGTLNIQGNITQPGATALALYVDGDSSGELILSGTNNSYTGGTFVDPGAGTLVVTTSNSLPLGGNLTVGDGSVFPTSVVAPRFTAASPADVSRAGVAAVPEPGTLVLLAVGALFAGFGAWRRRKGI